LVYPNIVVAKVRSKNGVGWSDFSNQNSVGGFIITEPNQMASPQRGPRTDKYNIDVVWTPLFGADLCGSQTISYNLQWDKGMGGTSNWFDLVGLTDNFLELSYLVTFDSIVGGRNYQFRIRAENSEGFSQVWSPVATITANAIPD